MELAVEPQKTEPGTRIGRYQVIRRVAVGGMAEIFLARATGIEGFEKRVIIKRILHHLADNADFVSMFLDEARLAATLHHANIAQVYDIGSDDGSYFFAMEYIEGKDVRHISKRLARLNEEMPLEHAIAMVLGIAAGLHAAHERRGHDGQPLNIVHRDVSPSNIIVTFDGGVKLIDFGIAKAAQRQTHTRTGVLKGKSAYMSPEQWLGENIDRRSDVFALGTLLYELTVGERLFVKGAEYEIMRQFVKGKGPLNGKFPPVFPTELERIIRRALCRHPDERYQTAQAFFIDLERFARNEQLYVSAYALADWLQQLFPDEGPAADAGEPIPILEPDSGPVIHAVPTYRRPSTGPRARSVRDGEVSSSELTSGEFETFEIGGFDIELGTCDFSEDEITVGTVHVADGVEVKLTESVELEITRPGRPGSETSTITLPRTLVDIPLTHVDIPVTRVIEVPLPRMMEPPLKKGRTWIHGVVVLAALAVAGGAGAWLYPDRTAPEGEAVAAPAPDLEPTGLPESLARVDELLLAPMDADVPTHIASTDWAPSKRRFAVRPRPKAKPKLKVQARPKLKVQAKPKAKPAADSTALMDAEPAAEPEPEATSDVETEAEAAPETAPAPAPEAETAPEAKTAPEAEAETAPATVAAPPSEIM